LRSRPGIPKFIDTAKCSKARLLIPNWTLYLQETPRNGHCVQIIGSWSLIVLCRSWRKRSLNLWNQDNRRIRHPRCTCCSKTRLLSILSWLARWSSPPILLDGLVHLLGVLPYEGIDSTSTKSNASMKVFWMHITQHYNLLLHTRCMFLLVYSRSSLRGPKQYVYAATLSRFRWTWNMLAGASLPNRTGG
jgi:hypothetical protein